MFVVKHQYEFTWPVSVKVPTDGTHSKQTFKGRFKALSNDEIQDLAKGRPLDQRDAEVLRMAWIGWEGVVDEHEETIPFSEAVRDELLGIPFVRDAVAAAFIHGLAGRAEKN